MMPVHNNRTFTKIIISAKDWHVSHRTGHAVVWRNMDDFWKLGLEKLSNT